MGTRLSGATPVDAGHRGSGSWLRRGAQDLVGTPQLTVLPLELGDATCFLAGDAWPGAFVDLDLLDPVAQRLGVVPSCSPTRRNGPDRVAGSRRASTANLIARSRSSSEYFLGAAMTLILAWIESLHQTRTRDRLTAGSPAQWGGVRADGPGWGRAAAGSPTKSNDLGQGELVGEETELLDLPQQKPVLRHVVVA